LPVLWRLGWEWAVWAFWASFKPLRTCLLMLRLRRGKLPISHRCLPNLLQPCCPLERLADQRSVPLVMP
jgi:hypothetical protein